MSEGALASVGVPDPSAPDFLNWVRNEVLRLQQALIPPAVVTNLRATALGGSIQVDFTRSDGDNFVLYWNSTPSINGSVRIELGSTNKYVDNIGTGGVKRYYVVKSKKGNTEGAISAWVSATSLALGTAVPPPTPPPDTQLPLEDQESGAIAIGIAEQQGFRTL